MSSVITIDVHKGDRVEDLSRCNEYLLRQGVRATFFIPTAMLGYEGYAACFREIRRDGHEIGTHGHFHDYEEMNLLKGGSRKVADRLRWSKGVYEEFFSESPQSFRSPCWCGMSGFALEVLGDLGYKVDASATPQRLGLLSSFPLENPYLFSRRSPYFVKGGLLEIPTSCFLIPLGEPSYRTLPRWAMRLFLAVLLLEKNFRPNRFINVQMHPADFSPCSRDRAVPRPFSLRDIVPLKTGGVGFRRLMRENDAKKIFEMTEFILGSLADGGLMTLVQAREAFVEARREGADTQLPVGNADHPGSQRATSHPEHSLAPAPALHQ